jgi:transcriptional regulator with XRE-family HTH domain
VKASDLQPLCEALYFFRKERGLNQGDIASELGISRKTYVLLESNRWLPQPRAQAHFVKQLHRLHPPLAKVFADLMGASVADFVEVRPVVASPPPAAGTTVAVPLEAKHAELVLDSAILGVAEQLDMSPRALRPIVAALLERLAAAGMPMGQAATIAKTPPRPSP